ncbi:MAG TPA: DUF202 domain-containing protein [Segeticoccus sp.]|uniref:YidH family protein n=1 Tax=Segeticoccus sp. TaxID=2706531 RepID=UPI002D80328D|nr:DUF202 domain-containing protein [Segeticoccus sp.]HET8599341.1 DUF202 domain-containing protein [Segeticoccus sp.]
MNPGRRPGKVYQVGEEPDPRFSLANERTALAWMRTALAIVAGGVALVSLASVTSMPAWTPLVGAAACVGGGITALRAVFGWRRVERALREKRPLPAPHALLPLAIGVGLLSLVMVGLSLVELARR